MSSAQFWIGTSGFQYPEWKGKFYPVTLATAKMLIYYAGQFNSTEINYTFRSTPTEKTIKRWYDETPGDFRFALKAPQKVTHFAKLKNCSEVMAHFLVATAGLGDKRGPVLFQLPPTFKADASLLREFLDSMSPAKSKADSPWRIAFEFRHESWLTDEIYTILADHNAALCIAESEDFTTPRVATADFGYLRPRREDYTPAQLSDLAQWVRAQTTSTNGKAQWKEVYGYFKHEETCVGPGFAGALVRALAQ